MNIDDIIISIFNPRKSELNSHLIGVKRKFGWGIMEFDQKDISFFQTFHFGLKISRDGYKIYFKQDANVGTNIEDILVHNNWRSSKRNGSWLVSEETTHLGMAKFVA